MPRYFGIRAERVVVLACGGERFQRHVAAIAGRTDAPEEALEVGADFVAGAEGAFLHLPVHGVRRDLRDVVVGSAVL